MNENAPMQEKEFNVILNDLLRFEERRNKIIHELRGVAERLKPINSLAKEGPIAEQPKQDPGMIYQFLQRLKDIDRSNDYLAEILERLNQLF